MITSHCPVAVLGGGLGGLTLARVLRVHGIEAAVFEREDSRRSRAQGGMLDIHAQGGQDALRAAGLLDQFQELVHTGGEAMRIVDPRGAVRYEEQDDGTGERPEVDRGQLRDLLLGSLPDGAVQWGMRATEVEELGYGRNAVHFADGTTITTDLLVGADGAWSTVRPRVSDVTPDYTGLSFVETDLVDADTRHPECAELVGRGFFISVSRGRGFLAHREPDGSLHVYTALKAEESWVDTLDVDNPAAAKESVLAQFGGWHDTLRALVADADGPLVPRRVHALPVGHRWARVPGVTLLGDAAHLMSPFAGEGANLAMVDGAALGRAVAAHPGETESALHSYEGDLFRRGEESARESAANMEMMFGADGLDRLVAQFSAFDRLDG